MIFLGGTTLRLDSCCMFFPSYCAATCVDDSTPHKLTHTHTHFLPSCVWCEGVSTLGLPCMGGSGLCQGTDGGGWAGGQQGIEAAGAARTLLILWPRLGENKQSPDAGFFFFAGTLHYSCCRKSCTHSTMLGENGGRPVAGLLFNNFTQDDCKLAVTTWIYCGHGWMTISLEDWQKLLLIAFRQCSGHISLRFAFEVDRILKTTKHINLTYT